MPGKNNRQKERVPKMSASCVGGGAQSQSQSVHNVFVYGSLLADDVVKVLLKRIPPSSSAILNGLLVSLKLFFSLPDWLSNFFQTTR